MNFFKPYPAMKDSGVPWLGKVPAHWDIAPPKRALQSRSAGTVPIKNKASPEPRDGLVPAFSAAGQDVWLPTAMFRGPGLVLSAVGARCGKTFRADGAWAIVANTHVLLVRSGHLRDYWWYVTDREGWWERAGAAQPFVQVSKTLDRPWAAPPLPEQAAIVQFLNHADRRIRRYIRAKQNLIKLLEEQKQVIIHRAVTRGLDPSVRLKPSGVEWLGDMPDHWPLVPNRSLLKLEKRSVGSAWGEHLLLSLTKRGVIPRDMVNPEGKFPASFESYQEVRAGDLVFCLFDIDETPRAVGLSTQGGMVTGAYTCFSCDPLVADWVYLFYLAMDNGKRLKPLYTGLRKVITKSAFLSAKMPLPPASERTAILAHVGASTREADKAIDQARRGIDLSREYRARLIADVVTGKVDVREAAAALPDETDEQEAFEAEVAIEDSGAGLDVAEVETELEDVEA
jgi:type I restriction enzyme S subunit